MNQYLYTVTEAANLLKLHPKTLRRKIQHGEVGATKVGKQYRLTREQIEKFCGTSLDSQKSLASASQKKVLVSAVIDIHAISSEDSSRITNLLLASQKNAGVGSEINPTRIDSIYSTEIGYLKILISGDISVVQDLMMLIETITSAK